MKKQNKDTGAIKKTIDELCTPNGISIGNENTKYTPVNSDKQPIVEGELIIGSIEWLKSENLRLYQLSTSEMRKNTELIEALQLLSKEVNISSLKLNVKNNFSLLNAKANADKLLTRINTNS